MVNSCLHILLFSLSIFNVIQNFEHLPDTFTARNAFSARFIREILEKISGHLHHIGILIQYQNTAGSYRRSQLGQFVKIQRRIDETLGDGTSHRSSEVNGFER